MSIEKFFTQYRLESPDSQRASVVVLSDFEVDDLTWPTTLASTKNIFLNRSRPRTTSRDQIRDRKKIVETANCRTVCRNAKLIWPGALAHANVESASNVLSNAHRRLEYLLMSTPAVIYASSARPPYDPTFISSHLKQQLGYEPFEFVNHAGFWADQIHPDDKIEFLPKKLG